MNIARTEGYPLCAEVLQVLDENSRMIERIFSRVGLASNSAVILDAATGMLSGIGQSSSISPTLLLVRNSSGSYSIVKVTARNTTDYSNAKVVVGEDNRSVINGSGVTFDGVYRLHTATIEPAASNIERWNFYNFDELFEIGLYGDMLPGFEVDLVFTTTADGYPGTFNTIEIISGSILERNARKLRIKLSLRLDYSSPIPTKILFPIRMTSVGYYPLTASIVKTSDPTHLYPVAAWIKGSYIEVDMTCFETYFTETYSSTTQRNDTIHINSEVVL